MYRRKKKRKERNAGHTMSCTPKLKSPCPKVPNSTAQTLNTPGPADLSLPKSAPFVYFRGQLIGSCSNFKGLDTRQIFKEQMRFFFSRFKGQLKRLIELSKNYKQHGINKPQYPASSLDGSRGVVFSQLVHPEPISPSESRLGTNLRGPLMTL